MKYKMNNQAGLRRYVCLLMSTVSLLIAAPLFSQTINSNAVNHWNGELAKIAYVPEAPGWYKFRPDAVRNGASFFTNYKAAMGLLDSDDMRPVRTDIDPQGIKHYRFQQYYKGIKIEGAEFIVHEKDNAIRTANGKMVYNMNKSILPKLNEAGALIKALQLVPSSLYRETPKAAELIRNSAYRPKGELVFQKAHPDSLFSPQNFRLCYRFDIYKATGEGYAVYIDAANGETVSKMPLQSDCSPTTVVTNYYNTKTINTTYVPFNIYMLEDNCTSSAITVYDNQEDTNLHYDKIYTMTNNTNWNSTTNNTSAASSLWCCRRALDMYQSVFGRSGYDGKNGAVSIFQNAGFVSVDKYGIHSKYYQNASFGSGIMLVGNNTGTLGNSGDDWNALDIIGHEFTHGITQTSWNNQPTVGEAGALNESFSDIFGTYLEYWDGSSPFDWTVGEDGNHLLRDMSNPYNTGQPKTYHDDHWGSTSNPSDQNDYGSVHQNTGVQNYWFYLLSQGGSGTNYNGLSYSVTGIGINQAAAIAYNNDVYYLSSGSDYIDAREGSLAAAQMLYGSCSQQAIAVGKAWYATGVGGSQDYMQDMCGGNFIAAYPSTTVHGIDNLLVGYNCTTVVKPSANMFYITASNTIHFYPGFQAVAGSNVYAYINPCDITSQYSVGQNTIAKQVLSDKNTEVPKPAEKTGLTAYPNPASGKVNISFTTGKNESNVVIKLYNMQMQEVKRAAIETIMAGRQTTTLDVSNLPQGMYLAVVQLQTEKLTAKISVIR